MAKQERERRGKIMKKRRIEPPCFKLPDHSEGSNNLNHKVQVFGEYSLPVDTDEIASLEREETAVVLSIYMQYISAFRTNMVSSADIPIL